MQRGNGGRDDLFGFGDPFAGFGNFGQRSGSLMSSIFGGRDPFDDPFFTQPFGNSMMGPSMMGPSLMGPSMGMFGPSLFGSGGGVFGEPSNAGFLEQQAAPPPTKSKGPIIEELSSDSEEEGDKLSEERKENSRKHSRPSKEPYVQDPDEEVEEKKSKHVQFRGEFNRAQPQAQTYSFHSSTVTYGGPNGAYYTSSKTRRAGGDGVVIEESKEADTTTGKAAHRVSRGIRDKGHSLSRNLNSDGRVQSVETLHNLNEDELPGFDEAWKGEARQHLPGWNQDIRILDNVSTGGSSRHDKRHPALPSTVPHHASSGRVQPVPVSQHASSGGRVQPAPPDSFGRSSFGRRAH